MNTDLTVKETTAAVDVVQEENLEQLSFEIRTLTAQGKQIALTYIIEIGHRLMAAKEKVGHGNWGEWLKNEVDYSQSTAENYIKIYKAFGGGQQSLLYNNDSGQLETLDYTKLLLLADVAPEEREEVIKKTNPAESSTRELKEKIQQLKKEKAIAEQSFKNETERLEAEKKAAEEAAQKKEETIAALQEQLAQTEQQETMIDREAVEAEKEKLQKKIDKEKKAKEKEIQRVKELEEQLKRKDTEIQEKVKEMAKKELDKMQKENDKKLAELEKKVTASANPNLIKSQFYFDEIQAAMKNLAKELTQLEAEQPETGKKLKTGIRKTLETLTAAI